MYIEMIDETGQVSEKLKEQTLELLDFAAEKTWQGRQGNGCYICNQRTQPRTKLGIS